MSVEDISRFRREYEILRNLDIKGVVRACELVDEPDTISLIMEHVSGEPLSRLLSSHAMSLPAFLQMAVQLAGTIAELHRLNIVHMSINATEVFWDAASSEMTLCGFEYASTLPHSIQAAESPAVVEGNLPYISPEQTGRMNRSVDYRTDLYSLGVVFYEILTRQLPFSTHDPVELVHSHLARKPVPPRELSADVPEVLSDIVMKLLEKNAEDRYQSARGLQADLQHCLDQLQSSGQVGDFDIGRVDHPDVLQISQKLYGREREVGALLEAFDDVSAGNAVLMLVAGYSGVGKTSLVREAHRPITAKRGYFVSGKYDQFTRNVPYAAIVQAFQELVGKILTESNEQVARWKESLQRALGVNGRVITDIIPEVELIIGEQPDVPELSPEAARNRFHFVFQSFVRVFASRQHPLVIFLDDLQWVDLPSLKLLEQVFTRSGSGHLLVLGAYRDNEVDETHPLISAEKALREAGTDIRAVELQPIDSEDVNRLISDTLFQDTAETREATDLVYSKTGGNPFYVKAFLRSLYDTGLLNYSPETRSWRCDLPAVGQLDVTDNVAEFLAENMENLPSSVQRSLQYASCVGNRFDLHTVATSQGKTQADTAAELEEAIRRGFIAPEGDEYRYIQYVDAQSRQELAVHTFYRFLHDRVQEAADRFLSDDERTAFHLDIGRQMRSDAEEADTRDERVIDFTQHLNEGCRKIASPAELLELARLNLLAGHKAKASAAFEQAYSFYRTGIRLLAPATWQHRHDLTLSLYEEAAEAAYLCGDHASMERFFQTVIKHAPSDLDKVRVYEVKIMVLIAEDRQKEAIAVGLKVLERLGLSIPEDPDREMIETEHRAVLELLKRRSNEEILGLPLLGDSAGIAIHRTLNRIIVPAFMSDLNLYSLLTAKLVRLSIKFGNSIYSVPSYGIYGAMFTDIQENIETANRLGSLAVALVEQLNAQEENRARVAWLVYALIRPWSMHLGDTLKPLREAILAGRDVGDIEWAGRLMCFTSTFSILVGRELNESAQEVAADNALLARHGQTSTLHWSRFYQQVILNLLGRSQAPHLLIGEAYDETRSLQDDLASDNGNWLFLIYFFKLILSYLFGRYEEAVDYAGKAEAYVDAISGLVFVSVLPFYQSLSLLAVYSERTVEEQKRIRSEVSRNQRKTRRWAEYAPMNQLHRYHIVEAERARIRGHNRQAAEHYDRAIELAEKHAYINDGALANELAARFYERQGRSRFAEVYIREAYRLYGAWGAEAKTDELSQQYPDWVGNLAATRGSMHEGKLDVDAIVRASQTFSDVTMVGDMLQRMMKIVMENAGAERGVLLLQKHGRWSVEAEGTVHTDEVRVLQPGPVDRADSSRTVPLFSDRIVNYAIRTKKSVVLDHAEEDELFTGDPYIEKTQPKSVLCLPIHHLGELLAVLYLENNLVKGAFTEQRLQVLDLLSSQIAISLNNAMQYDDQIQQLRYLYRLRMALGGARSSAAVIRRTGEALAEALSAFTSAGVRIEHDGRTWTFGETGQEGQAHYERALAWKGRERGKLHVFCGAELAEPQERALLDETIGQMVRVLEARELEMELLQSSRLVSLGQMAAGVAHELNQPLMVISTTAGDICYRLIEGVELPRDDLKGMMQDVLEVVERMDETVDHPGRDWRFSAVTPPTLSSPM